MLKLTYTLGLIGLAFVSPRLLLAQASTRANEHEKSVTYLLPDGKVFNISKWDSLEQAWGKGRILFNHNEEDDKKGIVHLVRITDEERKELDNRALAGEKLFASMLNGTAPDFELTDVKGMKWSLSALQGRIVVLNFWFTSCAPCIQEMPQLNKLKSTYASKEVVFLALTFNDATKIEAFQKKFVFDYALLPDSKTVIEKYNVSSYPTSMVINRQGIIKMIIQSSPEIGEELSKSIEAAL